MNNNTNLRKSFVDQLSKEAESPLKKYQDVFVGKQSLASLIKYELLISLISPIPGALGFLLRKLFYKILFADVGRGTVIGSNVTLRCPGQISLGSNVFIDDNVTLDAKGEGSQIKVGDSILIGKNSTFSCASSTINLGENITFGPNCYLRASRGPVNLGSFITIGGHTVIISGNPDYRRFDIPMMKQEGSSNGIIIGDDVWLGVGVRIIDGVKIGKGCVIGAGSVVIKDVPDFAIAAGVPAKVIGSRQKESRDTS